MSDEPVEVTISGPPSLISEVSLKSSAKDRRWFSPEQALTASVAIVSIVFTTGLTYCTQNAGRQTELINAEWVNTRRLESTTLDSLYSRLGQELRGTSDRRNIMIGRYLDLTLPQEKKLIDESNRIDTRWRDQKDLWDLRVRRYVDADAVPAWEAALSSIDTYAFCVEGEYRQWVNDHYRYRGEAVCKPDSTKAKMSLDGFRDAAVKAFREAELPKNLSGGK